MITRRLKPTGVKPRISSNDICERMFTVRMPAKLHSRFAKAARESQAKSLNALAVEAITAAVDAIESELNAEGTSPDGAA